MRELDRAIEAIRERKPRRVVAFPGAGVSADSGIPTFRGAEGLWGNFRAEDLATPGAFEREPETVWEWYEGRRDLIRKAQPNAAHLAIARRPGTTVVTQNVDGLHTRAGSPEVIELHGNTTYATCLDCGDRYEIEELRIAFERDGLAPTCNRCRGFVKTATISFGQAMPQEAMRRAEIETRAADLFIVLGSSLVVYPAAGFPEVAKRNGAALALVNREPTGLDRIADLVLHDAIGDVLVLEALYENLLAKLTAQLGSEELAVKEMLDISSKPKLFTTIRFGKHKGKRIEEIAREDRGYLEWLLREKKKEGEGEEDWIYTLKHFLNVS